VIKKTADNQRIVVSQTLLSRVRLSDKWPDHAVQYVGNFVAGGSPLGYKFIFQFKLKDGTVYNYWSSLFPTYGQAEGQYGNSSDYVNPDGVKGAFGEWFNYVVRPTLGNKAAG